MKKISLLLLFVAAVVFLFFFKLGNIPLWSSDEGRYGEIARAMWETRNFIVPRFNGVDYLDKPVMAPLLTSLAYALTGVNDFGTRLIPALAALLGLGVTWAFARKLFDTATAHLSALVLATTVGYVLVGRFAVIDMLMTLFLTLSLFFLLTAYQSRRGRYYLWAYVFMGFGFLTKGLIGFVLPGLVCLAFLVWRRDLGELKRMKIGWGILILFLMVLPWCIGMVRENPSFLKTFFIDQQFGRFLTGSFGRRKPFWFFVPILFATSFPWSLFLPSAVASGLKKDSPSRTVVQFLVCWVAVILVFFSIPKSKLPYYLLPVSPAVAVLIGRLFSSWLASAVPKNLEGFLRKMAGALAGICAALFVGGNVTFLFWKPFPEVASLQPVLFAGTLFLTLGAWGAWFFAKAGSLRKFILCLAAVVYTALIVTVVAMEKITPWQSTVNYANVVLETAREGDRICVFGSPDTFSDFPFHLKRRIVVAGSDRGTLKHEAEKLPADELRQWFLYAEPFVEWFNSRSERVFCLTRLKKMAELEGLGLKGHRVLKKDHGKILFSNF
ncbi:MAG: glycosyltransferase family 39 protein [Candidatus Omnitrophota bacterium]|jgi:4-amino-4-deoxy-L-arabinose transferase-like glycosyltransferase